MTDTYSFNASAADDVLRRAHPSGQCDCGGALEFVRTPLGLTDLAAPKELPGFLVAAIQCQECARVSLHEGLSTGIFRVLRGPDQD